MEFPGDWRKASVIPFFKKYEKQDLRSSGPVSFILVLVKLMEQVILEPLPNT